MFQPDTNLPPSSSLRDCNSSDQFFLGTECSESSTAQSQLGVGFPLALPPASTGD